MTEAQNPGPSSLFAVLLKKKKKKKIGPFVCVCVCVPASNIFVAGFIRSALKMSKCTTLLGLLAEVISGIYHPGASEFIWAAPETPEIRRGRRQIKERQTFR